MSDPTPYRLSTRALRLEKRSRLVSSRLKSYTEAENPATPHETEEKHEDLGWYLTILTDGPPVSFCLGSEKPELPLILHIEVRK